MSLVNITNVQIPNNPALFNTEFQFEITFECLAPLKEDLEFKVIYVGSAESEEYDQELDSIMVGPVPLGMNRFMLTTPAPNSDKIPTDDTIGVTVVLLTCSYMGREFVRVGYYVNNDYIDEELRENPPPQVDFSKLYRNILVEKPRVTRFLIEWDKPLEIEMPPENQIDVDDDIIDLDEEIEEEEEEDDGNDSMVEEE
ncbi:ASF1 like histone chaperone-domain-containing protein [Neocallimastix lanati (nom. inval.)]|jgi:histone chaperone ASF1|nr:ASF1 like histone chaperone-domain-containing protein [Neocallimastix sp. JGI-2020a]